MSRRIKLLFWNRDEGRLRAGFRLLIQFGLFLGMLGGLALLTSSLGPTDPGAFAAGSLYLVLGVALMWFVARFIDRRPVKDFGFHIDAGWWLDFAFGVFVGGLLMTGIFLIEYHAGWVNVTPAAGSLAAASTMLLLSLLVYLSVAFNEEFTFRGYQLLNLAEGFVSRRLGPRGAILLAFLLSAGIFGLAHGTNESATVASTSGIVLGGVLLSLPYLCTGELALSIGVHFSWNFFQGTVYGFPVSGSVPKRRLLVSEQAGPDLWTGGAFGPEAGLLAVFAVMIGCLLVIGWLKIRRKTLDVRVRLANATNADRPCFVRLPPTRPFFERGG
jgi:membrane protease YdiL (CAAX protease family)